MQWGLSTGDNSYHIETIILPISVTQIFSVVASTADPTQTPALGNSSNSGNVGNFKEMSFQTILDGPHGCWILVAKQQWGYFEQGGDRFTYPITFNQVFAAVKTCISNNTGQTGYVAYWTWFSEINNTYAPVWGNSYATYCIAIGIQQWGSPYVAGKNEFLLAFSEFVVMAASSEYSYTADNMVQVAYLNYFRCSAGTLASHRGWIALGI